MGPNSKFFINCLDVSLRINNKYISQLFVIFTVS